MKKIKLSFDDKLLLTCTIICFALSILVYVYSYKIYAHTENLISSIIGSIIGVIMSTFVFSSLLFLLINGFIICWEYIYSKAKQIPKEIYSKAKQIPKEKYNTIQDLFMKSAVHVNDTIYTKENLTITVYTAELVFHIFALWVDNHIKKYDTKAKKDEFVDSMNFNAYIIVIQEFLNLLIEKGIGQNGIDEDTIKAIIFSRLSIITGEKDFETRNMNYMSFCNLAIKYEEDCVFWIGPSFSFRIETGNPLDMLVLPSAYKSGLIDEFLEKLENCL